MCLRRQSKFLRDFKSVFNMIDFFDEFAAQKNFHNVKTTGAVGKIFVLQENARRLNDFPLLANVDGLDRQTVANV